MPIETAATVESGLALIRRLRPKLVLLDVNLPDGTGVEICAAIRMNPELNGAFILFISTHDADDLIKISREARADGFLCKPFDHEVLLSIVRDVIGNRTPGTSKV